MHHLSHQVITPPRLAADGQGFASVGKFRVIMQLDPLSDWTKLQYRQYIKGTCFLHHGSFKEGSISDFSRYLNTIEAILKTTLPHNQVKIS